MSAIVIAATLYVLLISLLIVFVYRRASRGRPLVAALLVLLCVPSIVAAPLLLSQKGFWTFHRPPYVAEELPCGSVRDPWRPIYGECEDFFRAKKVEFAVDLVSSGVPGLTFAAIAVFGVRRKKRLRASANASATDLSTTTDEAFDAIPARDEVTVSSEKALVTQASAPASATSATWEA